MADETPNPGGPESQGISFVFSVQDLGTAILDKAEKAYQSLMNTMRNVAQQSDKFVTGLLSKMAQTAASEKANGGVAPIVTPFTLSQKALDMMPKFAKASYDWLKNSANGMAQWAAQIGIAGSRTRDFRDALAQSEIEGKKFTDQFAGVGTLMGQVVGSAIGKTAGAAATSLSGAVTSGIYMYSELYEKMHEVGMMQGWNTEQTTAATKRYMDMASALNLNVSSFANIAHAMSEAHIPMNQANEDLLKFAASSVELSQIKPGGAVNDESISAAIGNMIKIQKLNSQQVAAFLMETAQQVKTSSLTWVDALNLVGPAAQENFDQMFKGMSDVDRAARTSQLLPQIMAWGAAAKDANVPMEVLNNVLRALKTENTPEFQHLAAVLGQTGFDITTMQERIKKGDLTGAMNDMAAATKTLMNSMDSNATRAFFSDFNSVFGEGAALRIANMAKASRGIDMTAMSMENLERARAKMVAEKQDTPEGQLELLYTNWKNTLREIGAVNNPMITNGLKDINAQLKELYGYFSGSPQAAGVVFWAGVVSTGILGIASAFKTLQFLGITKVFTLMSEVIKGVAMSLRELAAGETLAETAGAPLGATLGVIAGGLLSIYELWKHKDFVEAWGKKIIGDNNFAGFVSNKTTYDSKDIKLEQRLQNLESKLPKWMQDFTLGGKYSGGAIPDSAYENKEEQQKQTEHLAAIAKNTKDAADASKKTPPLKASRGIDSLASWNEMIEPYLYP